MGYSKEDISLLNSARGLRSLLYKGKVDIDDGLRFARYYQELEKLQKELEEIPKPKKNLLSKRDKKYLLCLLYTDSRP